MIWMVVGAVPLLVAVTVAPLPLAAPAEAEDG